MSAKEEPKAPRPTRPRDIIKPLRLKGVPKEREAFQVPRKNKGVPKELKGVPR
jgi:hypothetical protein